MARKRSHTRRAPRSRPRGRIEIHRGGYGFVQTAEGEFFIPRSKMGGAFPDDLVEVAPSGHRQRKDGRRNPGDQLRRTARVVSVVERAQDEVIGHFRRAEPFGVVEPLDPRIAHDIFVPLQEAEGVPEGAVVRVRIATFPDRHSAATGFIVEVLGNEDDERLPIDLIVSRHKLETRFSEASLTQAQEASLDIEGALAVGYEDLRERFVFTIDPADARDFDDAISLDRAVLPDGSAGWRLGVSIADVANYVPWDSSIDLDARRRATSVYLVDRVIPMLPERLSDDLCSLRPDEPRRTMTVDLLLTPKGEVVDARPYEAIIRSDRRLTYEEAQALIDDSRRQGFTALGSLPEDPLAWRLLVLAHLTQQVSLRKQHAGALDFDTTEVKVRLDEEGYPLALDLRRKTEATELIEQSMILANEAVARYLRDRRIPCIYRIHESPAAETLEGIVPVLGEFDWFKAIDEGAFVAGNPRTIQQILSTAMGRPEAELVSTLLLRSMKRAIYSAEPASHYGLGSDAYAHFTSPIRRYPDLVVHRMLKAALRKRPEKFDQEVVAFPWIAEHSSEMERIAEQASRESQEVKIVEYMEQYVGQTFSALVSGVTSFGLFVTLENGAEGVLEMGDLGHEYFILDPVRHSLTGSDSGKQFRLGKRIAVNLVEADRRSSRLRFRLA